MASSSSSDRSRERASRTLSLIHICIDVNDFNVKLRNAQKFLADGNRCKITVRFRGREMAHTNIGQDLLLKFAESCGETAVMDKSPKLEGRHMSIFLDVYKRQLSCWSRPPSFSA